MENLNIHSSMKTHLLINIIKAPGLTSKWILSWGFHLKPDHLTACFFCSIILLFNGVVTSPDFNNQFSEYHHYR